MSEATWQEDNHQYLAASLHWLRLQLQAALPTVAPTPKSWLIGGQKPTEPGAELAAALERAALERAQCAEVESAPALTIIANRFGLSEFEQDILLLCTAMELDPGIAALYAQHPANQGRNYPTFALSLALLGQPAWDALSASRPLRSLQLLEINQPGATPLTASALRIDEHILNFIKGLTNIVDSRLLPLVTLVTGEAELSDSQHAKALEAIQQIPADANGLLPAVVQLVGEDSESSQAVALAICRQLNADLFRIAAADLPASLAELETFSRLWQRENRLLHLALYIDAGQIDNSNAEAATLQRFLQKQTGLVLVELRETPLRLTGLNFVAEVQKPDAREQHQAWLDLLTPVLSVDDAQGIARRLAGQFDLNLTEIRQAVGHVANLIKQKAPETAEELSDHLWSSCRDLTRPRLDVLSQHLEAKATWDDLVVSDESARLLHQIADQVQQRHQVYQDWGFGLKMNRGFGISALFTGDSGTGKTMAAEVIANDLQLNLYRIDLSAVVSKYIGETEKNLRKLFDAAEQGGAILFFDEADALFGKRSEVKDSHDRYANIEINYLLQRMEAFTGLAILATNMKSALDPAFMRRLRFIVEFQFPSAQERKAIWQKAFPKADPAGGRPGTPVDETLDYDRLARFSLSGGNIHSIALNAAFLAAKSGGKVSMAHILEAIRSELRKLNKPVNEAEFRQLEVVRGVS